MLLSKDRFGFSERTKPLAEHILYSLFHFVRAFEWTNQANATLPLDYDFGIDLIARCFQHQPLTFQVKVLNQDYHTVTIETKGFEDKPGDWESCLAQFQLIIYSLDGRSISRWVMLDNARLVLCSNQRNLIWSRNANKYGCSSFKYIHLSDLMELAPECIVYWGGDWKTQQGSPASLISRWVNVDLGKEKFQ